MVEIVRTRKLYDRDNDGIILFNSTITSANGDILLKGTGRGTGESSNGIQIGGDLGFALSTPESLVESTGTGNITIIATGSDGEAIDYNNSGLQLNLGSRIASASGNINLIGIAKGSGKNNIGIEIKEGGVVESTITGSIILKGTGGNGTEGNTGILVDSGTISVNQGDIDLIGMGGNGNGNDNDGIDLTNDALLEIIDTGSITLTGTGGTGTDLNSGIVVDLATVSVNKGDIELKGTGGNGNGSENYGIDLTNDALLEIIDTGNITLTGTGGSGTDSNVGIVVDLATVSVNQGNIELKGIGGNGNGSDNDGIDLTNDALLEIIDTGNITLTGTGGSGTDSNVGIVVDLATISVNQGNIELKGTGGNGNGSLNDGIQLLDDASLKITGLGDINVDGTGGGEGSETNDNYGIYIVFPGGIEATNGIVNFIGTTGKGTDSLAIKLDSDVTFNSPITLRSREGTIDTSFSNITGTNNASITLEANGDIFTGNITTPVMR